MRPHVRTKRFRLLAQSVSYGKQLTPYVTPPLLLQNTLAFCSACFFITRKRCPPLCDTSYVGDIGAGYARVGQSASRLYFGQRAPDGQDELEAPYSGEVKERLRCVLIFF